MKNDMENKDWLNEYPVLKQVNPNNPFTVPSGYFSDLSERIVSFKNLKELNIDKDGFTVPANYFNELSGDIQSRITIASALNVENTGFVVPENYFDELNSNIQSRIAIEETIDKDAAFEVPQGYFENLQQQITARIAVEEALSTAPEESFALPAGYFEKLNADILNKTVNAGNEVADEQPMQRRGIVRRMFASGIYKYAVAACVTLIIGVSFLLNSGNKAEVTSSVNYLHDQLSEIPVSEIKSYVEQNLDAGDTQAAISQATDENVSDEEILDYIDIEI